MFSSMVKYTEFRRLWTGLPKGGDNLSAGADHAQDAAMLAGKIFFRPFFNARLADPLASIVTERGGGKV